MKREGIKIAYMGGYYTEMGLFVRQASDAHASLTVIANDPLMTGEFGRLQAVPQAAVFSHSCKISPKTRGRPT